MSKELEDLEKEFEIMNNTERKAGYESCDICGRYDMDAGGIDYWVYKGKKYCYVGCWKNLKNETEEKIKKLKN
jgi:hypothetical protein